MTTKIPVELSSTPGIVDGSNATAITIDSSENCSFTGTTTTTGYVIGNNTALYDDHSTLSAYSDSNGVYLNGKNAGWLSCSADGTQRTYIRLYGQANAAADVITFTTATSERMRIDASGNLLIGKTSLGNNTIGTEFKYSGGLFNITNSGSQCMTVNRLTNDGSIVIFQQDTTTEGSITVSGATVSYNGFSGSHESSGVASDTAIGTVCSTIDELDTYVSGTKEGQTRADHAKIKVSDTAGDVRVYGVLSSFSEEDNKPVVASVGIGSVLVTGACAGGDLLESNGDGTAKVQDDDIIRSKTIGKVTMGNTTASVKLVSCVLYCG